jgi:tRNA nucleotidyltransferase/poly(A) polymerase
MIYDLEDLKIDFPNMNFNWINSIQDVTQYLVKEWRFVGGCVRDSLLGKDIYDIDIATLANPDEILSYFSNKKFTIFQVGKKFGTISVIFENYKIEITTTRKDINTYGRSADVEFINSFEEDSERRDFTINALLLNNKNQLFDYHDGLKNLKNKEVIFINNASLRIEEDYLRILRYIRFFIRFGEKEILYKEEINKNLENLKKISIERVCMEIESMCKNNSISRAIIYLNELHISKTVFEIDLNANISDYWSLENKLIMIYWHINIKLPLNKILSKYISFKKLSDNYVENFAMIWQRNHSILMAKKYIELLVLSEHQLQHLEQYNILLNLNYEDKVSFFPSIIGPERSLKELEAKILLIKKHLLIS